VLLDEREREKEKSVMDGRLIDSSTCAHDAVFGLTCKNEEVRPSPSLLAQLRPCCIYGVWVLIGHSMYKDVSLSISQQL
jgi:hypothetical protein